MLSLKRVLFPTLSQPSLSSIESVKYVENQFPSKEMKEFSVRKPKLSKASREPSNTVGEGLLGMVLTNDKSLRRGKRQRQGSNNTETLGRWPKKRNEQYLESVLISFGGEKQEEKSFKEKRARQKFGKMPIGRHKDVEDSLATLPEAHVNNQKDCIPTKHMSVSLPDKVASKRLSNRSKNKARRDKRSKIIEAKRECSIGSIENINSLVHCEKRNLTEQKNNVFKPFKNMNVEMSVLGRLGDKATSRDVNHKKRPRRGKRKREFVQNQTTPRKVKELKRSIAREIAYSSATGLGAFISTSRPDSVSNKKITKVVSPLESSISCRFSSFSKRQYTMVSDKEAVLSPNDPLYIETPLEVVAFFSEQHEATTPASREGEVVQVKDSFKNQNKEESKATPRNNKYEEKMLETCTHIDDHLKKEEQSTVTSARDLEGGPKLCTISRVGCQDSTQQSEDCTSNLKGLCETEKTNSDTTDQEINAIIFRRLNDTDKQDSQLAQQGGKRKCTNNNQKEDNRLNLRRSKRRRSQPIRCNCNENERKQNNTDLNKEMHCVTCIKPKFSVGTIIRKYFKGFGYFSGQVQSYNKESLLYKIKYDDGDSEEISEEELNEIISDIPSSPSINCKIDLTASKSHTDLSANDTATAPETIEDGINVTIPLLACNGPIRLSAEQSEDDIFNATPMQKLLAGKTCSFEHSSQNVKQQHVERLKEVGRPKRKSVRPARYGMDYQESNGKSPANTPPLSAIHKKGVKSKAKKVVLIFSDEKENLDDDTDEAKVEWTSEHLEALLSAHKHVDPKSYSFWEDVSDLVGEKTATECREKWFSLVKTPVQKKKSKKASNEGKGGILSQDCLLSEDDIYHATPMKGLLPIGAKDNSIAGISAGELKCISAMISGSAIKISENVRDKNENLLGNRLNDNYLQGYKTYIQNMRRNLKQKSVRKKVLKGNVQNPLLVAGKDLVERADEGNIEMKCRLSPGGTLNIDSYGDSDLEDYLDYQEEDQTPLR